MGIRGQSSCAAAVLVATVWAAAAAAQPGSPDDVFEHRGLELSLRSLETGTVDTRVARLAALHVPRNEPVSPFLDPGPFEATFRGAVEIDLNDSFRFTIRGNGGIRLRIGGEVVLERETLRAGGEPASTAGEVRLRKGYNPIELVYRSPRGGDASVRLSWSNDFLPEEPVPPAALRRTASPELDRALERRAARGLVADAMCVRCHPVAATPGEPSYAMPELAAAAPDLDGVGSRLRRGWIEQWLLDPRSVRRHARMPRLLSTERTEARSQAADLAAYLVADHRASDGQASPPATSPTAGELADGRRLYDEIGCAACHGDATSSPPVDAAHRLVAPDPADNEETDDRVLRLRDKWEPSALVRYLRDPTAFDPWSRMPRLELEAAEAASLAAYLLAPAAEGGAAQIAASPTTATFSRAGDPERGRRLADELRCRSCHSLSDGEPPPSASPIGELAGRTSTWAGGDTDSGHPRYELDPARAAEIERFLGEDASSLARAVPAEYAERRIRSGSCLACHARDGMPAAWSPSLSATARAASEDSAADDFAVSTEDETGPDFLPPDLTWTGEKLRSDWLAPFLAGRLGDLPRPHLRVRMPAFPSDADTLATGLHHQHGLSPSPARDPAVDAELAAIGRDLIRGDRLGCHSCHALGGEPALGGEGSEETINFALVRPRLRRAYFDRFLRDPQRIMPGSKMPQFVDEDGYTAFYDVFDGEAERQFEAIWQYLGTLD
ncbi:MAG: hypothetical protein OXG81_14930 [Acidobacteria bacterium]|nr:hypothetical protein [Acidobacteriota bacterium]